MLEHNIWSWNSRVFPGISPLVARLGARVRVRIGNLTMTNHPIHIHGIEFEVTGTDGGPVPKTALGGTGDENGASGCGAGHSGTIRG